MHPDDRRYAKTHEWILPGDPATVGITQHAQEELGDLVYVELPTVGRTLQAGESFGTVESVKAVSEVYAPAGGEVVEVNDALVAQPELVNSSPYEDAWIIKLRVQDASQLDNLLDAKQYEELTASAEH